MSFSSFENTSHSSTKSFLLFSSDYLVNGTSLHLTDIAFPCWNFGHGNSLLIVFKGFVIDLNVFNCPCDFTGAEALK